MPAPAETVVLARVLTGWTGYIAITIGSTTAIVRPRPRTSAAEVWREVGRAAARAHGNPTAWRTFFDASGKAVVEGPTTFTLALSGSAQGRLGWSSASYSGSAAYTANTSLAAINASDPNPETSRVGIYTAGMGFNLEPGAWEQGSAHASSEVAGGAATHPLAAWAAGNLAFDAAMSQLLAGIVGFNWKSEALGLGLEGSTEWDVSFQGRLLGRVRIGATRIETRARGAGNLRVGLRARLQEVR